MKFEFSIRYVAIEVRTPREGDLRYRPAYEYHKLSNQKGTYEL